jgi:aspartokinase
MLEGLTPPERVFSCLVRKLRESLDESDQRILDLAIADGDSWPSKTLAVALTERGLPISDKPIRKHRAGLCSCK